MEQQPLNNQQLTDRFLDAIWAERGLSNNTLAAYRRDLQGFDKWLTEQNITSLLSVDRSVLQKYIA